MDVGLARETYLEALEPRSSRAARVAVGSRRGRRGRRAAPARPTATAADRPPPGWFGDAVHRVLRSRRAAAEASAAGILRAPWGRRHARALACLPRRTRPLGRRGVARVGHSCGHPRSRRRRPVGPSDCLTYRGGVHVHAGEFAAAAALVEQADAITEATGNAPLSYTSLVLAAWRGRRTGHSS